MTERKDRLNNLERHELEPFIEVVPRNILVEKIEQLHKKPNMAVGILLAGDRIACCDEGVIMKNEDNLIGIATIAPEGEEASGQPTIVALYVSPEYRNQGFGGQILKKTVERCVERGFTNIRMDVMSSNVKKIIDKLPEELQEKIDIHDLGNIMDDF